MSGDMRRLLGFLLLTAINVVAQGNSQSATPQARTAEVIVLPTARQKTVWTEAPSRETPRLSAAIEESNVYVLPKPDAVEAATNPTTFVKRRQIGIGHVLDLSTTNWGTWGNDPPRFRGAIRPSEKGARVLFKDFHLPAGARLYLYTAEHADTPAIYEKDGPWDNGEFWSDPFSSDLIFQLDGASARGDYFRIANASLFLSGVPPKIFDTEAAAGCNLDARCYPEWATYGDAVALMVFSDAEGTYACTGAMVNTAINDYSPLMLTANHCINTEALANSVFLYFFYRSRSCNSGYLRFTEPAYRVSTHLLAGRSREAGSDFSLLQVTGVLPDGIAFLGWTRDAMPSGTSVVAIHHPKASYQRIAFGAANNFEEPNYLEAIFNAGVTEPGSSGSPLLDSNGKLLGQLYGGFGSCSAPNAPDYYGAFSVSAPLMLNEEGKNYLDVGLPDDGDEPNNARSQATAFVFADTNRFKDRVIKRGNDDWYVLDLPASAEALIHFDHSLPMLYGVDYELYEGDSTRPVEFNSSTSFYHSQTNLEFMVPFRELPTRYYLRILLNKSSRANYNLSGSINPFGLPPTVTTPQLSGSYPHYFISGSFNANGTETSGQVEYGFYSPDSSYGGLVGELSGIGGGTFSDSQSHAIEGPLSTRYLIPGNVFGYRTVAFRRNPYTTNMYRSELKTFRISGPNIEFVTVNRPLEGYVLWVYGAPSPYLNIRATSTGDVPVRLASITAYSGGSQKNDCPEYLLPGASCTIYLYPDLSKVLPFSNGFSGGVEIKHNAAQYHENGDLYTDKVSNLNSSFIGISVVGVTVNLRVTRTQRPQRAAATANKDVWIDVALPSVAEGFSVGCEVTNRPASCSIEERVDLGNGKIALRAAIMDRSKRLARNLPIVLKLSIGAAQKSFTLPSN
jgi:hypothetical protein